MNLENYRSLFLTEAEEHLQCINTAVLDLERNPRNVTILHDIFRSVHTLKGMSATMGFDSLTRLTHRMEDVFDRLRSEQIAVTSEIVDVLFHCLDRLQLLLEQIKNNEKQSADIQPTLVELDALLAASTEKAVSSAAPQSASGTGILILSTAEQEMLTAALSPGDTLTLLTVTLAADCQLKSARVFMVMQVLATLGEVIKTQPEIEDLESNRFERTFSLLLQSRIEPQVIHKAVASILEIDAVDARGIATPGDLGGAAEQPPTTESDGILAAEPAAAGEPASFQQGSVRKIQSIRVSTERLDKLMNLVGELVIAKIRLMQVAQTQQQQLLPEILTSIDRLSSELQDQVMQARMIPMSQVFDRFPRMVRDLARSIGKQVKFEISGGEIEMDRTVLDEIADPLVHLLRNSVDHGIESPEERGRKNKNKVGTVRLKATRERTHVFISVTDDGKGIDPQQMRAVALRKGLMPAEELAKLNERDVLGLIMLPGFSSTTQITATSGRGVGMDVVKMKIEALGGSVSFESTVDQGSAFLLKLPLTVAIIRAMLITVRGEIYAVPIANIAETLKVSAQKVRHIEKFEVITLRDEVLPLLRLDKVLNDTDAQPSPAAGPACPDLSIVVVEGSGGRVGLVVNTVVGQQEVVIKQMGKHLKSIRGFSGATILGDGRVALILDVATLTGGSRHT